MRRGASSRLLASVLCAACVLFVSCGETYSYTSNRESLADGRDGRASVAFALNRRPVKLELYLRVSGGKAVVQLDHPDGRTTEALELEGPGVREIRKEFDKEPGSWGLRIMARGGEVTYWAALHDRKKYVGPDDEAKRLVERM